MDIQDISKIKEALQCSKKIAVVSHFNPDGDAIGSSLALYHYFKADGFDVSVIIPNPHPDFLGWMEGTDQVIVAQRNLDEARRVIKSADILFVVDMNAPHRAGQDLEHSISQFKGFRVLIDHHIQPEIPCDVMYSSTATSSASELVYNFLYKFLTPERDFSKAIAEALYVGIITDTGSVSYACNEPNTYHVLHRLIASGIDGEAIHRKVYDNYTESRIKLLGLALSQRLTVLPQYQTSYIYLTKQDLIDNHFQIGDTEGFVNYGLSIAGIQYTAFFVEREGRIRVSLRSKGKVDVNLFARTYYQGGGHKNAAGAFYHGDIQGAVRVFEAAAAEIYEQVLKNDEQ